MLKWKCFQRHDIIHLIPCIYGKIENIKHFLIECSNYTLITGQTIFTLPGNVNIKILLSGNELTDMRKTNLLFKLNNFILSFKQRVFWY